MCDNEKLGGAGGHTNHMFNEIFFFVFEVEIVLHETNTPCLKPKMYHMVHYSEKVLESYGLYTTFGGLKCFTIISKCIIEYTDSDIIIDKLKCGYT
jgi:hypothetical protein